MKSELYYLKEHMAQGFIEDISEQEFYMQKLALERFKKVRDPNICSRKSQCALDKFINYVNLAFQIKPLIYASKEIK